MAAIVGFEPANFRTQSTEPTTKQPCLTSQHAPPTCLMLRYCQFELLIEKIVVVVVVVVVITAIGGVSL